MPMPKAVTIDGNEIDEVQGVNIVIETPVGPRGDYEGRTHAATVKVFRRARNTPKEKLFKAATNEDGRLNIISAQITLQDAGMADTYVFSLQQCYIHDWTFQQPEDDDMLFETITLKVGNMSINAGGSSKSFIMPEFNLAAGK